MGEDYYWGQDDSDNDYAPYEHEPQGVRLDNWEEVFSNSFKEHPRVIPYGVKVETTLAEIVPEDTEPRGSNDDVTWVGLFKLTDGQYLGMQTHAQSETYWDNDEHHDTGYWEVKFASFKHGSWEEVLQWTQHGAVLEIDQIAKLMVQCSDPTCQHDLEQLVSIRILAGEQIDSLYLEN